MSEAVTIAVVSALGLILSGVLVELVRARHRQDTVVTEVTPNGGASIKDAVGRIEADLKEIRAEQNRHGQRIAGVEATLATHLLEQRRL